MGRKDMAHNFLSILIRTHKRPKFLRRCLNSLDKQTKKNFVIILISDQLEDKVEDVISEYPNLSFLVHHIEEPVKFPQCNIYFNMVKDIIDSDYIIFIDDDNEVKDSDYCKELENIYINKGCPAVIMSHSIFPSGKIVPEDQYWKNLPIIAHIDTLNFCVRYDIYKKFSWLAKRAGDYSYIRTIFENINWKKDVYWYDKVTTIRNTGRGKENGWNIKR